MDGYNTNSLCRAAQRLSVLTGHLTRTSTVGDLHLFFTLHGCSLHVSPLLCRFTLFHFPPPVQRHTVKLIGICNLPLVREFVCALYLTSTPSRVYPNLLPEWVPGSIVLTEVMSHLCLRLWDNASSAVVQTPIVMLGFSKSLQKKCFYLFFINGLGTFLKCFKLLSCSSFVANNDGYISCCLHWYFPAADIDL